MIEAAIVLPLLLLAVISIVYMGLHFHESFREQIMVQRLLIYEAQEDNSVFALLREDTQTSVVSKGLFEGSFYRYYKQRLYVINEGLVLRAGEVVGNVKAD